MRPTRPRRRATTTTLLLLAIGTVVLVAPLALLYRLSEGTRAASARAAAAAAPPHPSGWTPAQGQPAAAAPVAASPGAHLRRVAHGGGTATSPPPSPPQPAAVQTEDDQQLLRLAAARLNVTRPVVSWQDLQAALRDGPPPPPPPSTGVAPALTPVVHRLWRAGKLDWHELVPTGDRHTAAAKRKVVNFLLGTEGVNLGSGDHGRLHVHRLCSVVEDVCLVHSTVRGCVENELCGWCAARGVCVSRLHRATPLKGAANCAEPLWTTRGSALATAGAFTDVAVGSVRYFNGKKFETKPVEDAGCSLVVTRSRAVGVGAATDDTMFYHWALSTLRSLWSRTMDKPALFTDLRTHLLLMDGVSTAFSGFFGLFSNYCWRWSRDLPKGVCFARKTDMGPLQLAREDLSMVASPPAVESRYVAAQAGMRYALPSVTDPNEAMQHMHKLSEREFIMATLGLDTVRLRRPLVTIVSRRNKRFILNERELLAACRSLNVDAQLVGLEEMTVHEQMYAFAHTTILVGIHGSALTNAQFLQRGTALLQLMPYKVMGGSSFFRQFASAAGARYYEWTNTHRNNAVFHWHYMSSHASHEEVLERGSTAADQATWFGFWIQQDTWVDEAEFRQQLLAILTDDWKHNVHKRLWKPPPDV